MYIVHELGFFFHNTPDLPALHHTRPPLHNDTGHIFPPIIYLGWGDKGDQDPSLGMLEFRQRQRERERSRIEMQLEEVPPKVGIVDD